VLQGRPPAGGSARDLDLGEVTARVLEIRRKDAAPSGNATYMAEIHSVYALFYNRFRRHARSQGHRLMQPQDAGHR